MKPPQVPTAVFQFDQTTPHKPQTHTHYKWRMKKQKNKKSKSLSTVDFHKHAQVKTLQNDILTPVNEQTRQTDTHTHTHNLIRDQEIMWKSKDSGISI